MRWCGSSRRQTAGSGTPRRCRAASGVAEQRRPSWFLGDRGQLAVRAEQLIDVGAQARRGRYSSHGCRSFREFVALRRKLRPPSCVPADGRHPPRRDDRGPEPHPLTGLDIDPSVGDTGLGALDRPRPGRETSARRARCAPPTADPPRCARPGARPHGRPPRPPTPQPTSAERPRGRSRPAPTGVLARRLLGRYSEHRRSFFAGVPAPAEPASVRGRSVAPSNGSPIHDFSTYLPAHLPPEPAHRRR